MRCGQAHADRGTVWYGQVHADRRAVWYGQMHVERGTACDVVKYVLIEGLDVSVSWEGHICT